MTAADIIKSGYMYGIAAAALDFFVFRRDIDESLCGGIAFGVSVVGGTLLWLRGKYIDNRTEEDN